jgi:hypothetical protein
VCPTIVEDEHGETVRIGVGDGVQEAVEGRAIETGDAEK